MDAQPPVSAYASAEAALADGAFEFAIDLLETVLAVDAEDIAALDLLGQVAQRIDALDSAIDAYQRVLAIDPVYRDTVERLAGAEDDGRRRRRAAGRRGRRRRASAGGQWIGRL